MPKYMNFLSLMTNSYLCFVLQLFLLSCTGSRIKSFIFAEPQVKLWVSAALSGKDEL